MPEASGAGAHNANVPGVERAAILLLSLGEDNASEVLKHMGPKEVQKLGTAMATLSNVSRDMVGAVLQDFVTTVQNQTALGIGADDYIRNVLVNALGADKAGGVIDRILLGKNSKGLEQLKWMDPRQIAELIRLEHPQIIA
ncbi:MAG: flagellar motor switch protein FliG, partial [Anaerolineae bacterium]|nr:flagellar motor switch protein FliG [Anaerolineae bacterium]